MFILIMRFTLPANAYCENLVHIKKNSHHVHSIVKVFFGLFKTLQGIDYRINHSIRNCLNTSFNDNDGTTAR